jgi:hypothetical protein
MQQMMNVEQNLVAMDMACELGHDVHDELKEHQLEPRKSENLKAQPATNVDISLTT